MCDGDLTNLIKKQHNQKVLHISNSGFWIVTNLPFWQVRNSYKMLSYKLTTDVVKTKQPKSNLFWLGKNKKTLKQLSGYLIKTKQSLKALRTSGFYTFGVCASKSSSKWSHLTNLKKEKKKKRKKKVSQSTNVKVMKFSSKLKRNQKKKRKKKGFYSPQM